MPFKVHFIWPEPGVVKIVKLQTKNRVGDSAHEAIGRGTFQAAITYGN
jgi:hypothetical protein